MLPGLLSAIATQSVGGILVPSGLIGYWPTNDGTGTTVTATIGTNAAMTGSMTWAAGPKGVSGTAIEATANSSIARVPQATAPRPSTAISMCFWLRRTAARINSSPIWMPPASNVAPFVSYGMAFDSSTGTNLGIYLGISGALQFHAGTASTLNTWEFWTGTWETGVKLKTFKNGTLEVESAATQSGSISYYDQDLCFCGSLLFTNRWPAGQVANVRVYDRAITTTEMTTIYDAEKP